VVAAHADAVERRTKHHRRVLDDMGFSDIGPFGAEVSTPTLDRLAREGLRYTNYHTTPVCSRRARRS